jgi:hypothetical protein
MFYLLKLSIKKGNPILAVSIFAQVNITNPTSWLVKFDVVSCYIHLQVNIFANFTHSLHRLGSLQTLVPNSYDQGTVSIGCIFSLL